MFLQSKGKVEDEEDCAQGCSVLHAVAAAVIKQSESGLEEAVDDENMLELSTLPSQIDGRGHDI